MPLGLGLDGKHLGIELGEYPADVFLVLLGVKGARAIDQDAAVVEAGPRIADNLALQLPAFLYVLRAPFADGGRVLAEHAFARAGHVAENQVELHLGLSVITGVGVGDDVILVAPLRHVLQQDAGPLLHGFVAIEHTILGQGRTE